MSLATTLNNMPIYARPAMGFAMGLIPPLLMPGSESLFVCVITLAGLFTVALYVAGNAVGDAANGLAVALILVPIGAAFAGGVIGASIQVVVLSARSYRSKGHHRRCGALTTSCRRGRAEWLCTLLLDPARCRTRSFPAGNVAERRT